MERLLNAKRMRMLKRRESAEKINAVSMKIVKLRRIREAVKARAIKPNGEEMGAFISLILKIVIFGTAALAPAFWIRVFSAIAR